MSSNLIFLVAPSLMKTLQRMCIVICRAVVKQSPFVIRSAGLPATLVLYEVQNRVQSPDRPAEPEK